MSVRLCCVSVIGLCYILFIYSILFRGAVFSRTRCVSLTTFFMVTLDDREGHWSCLKSLLIQHRATSVAELSNSVINDDFE